MRQIINHVFGLAIIFVFVSAVSLATPLLLSSSSSKAYAAATGFNAGHIIDNNIFTNGGALSVQQIQTFLNDMVGTCYAVGSKSTNPLNGACINQYVENTTTLQNNFTNPSASIPGGISAAQIIYNAAQQYNINPEVLLVTMEKEQGLTTDNWPWYSEYQAAMGYECPDSSPSCNGSTADFYKQIDGAAWQFRDYLNNPGAFNYWIGPNTIDYAPGCGGSTVNIQNAATAALYIYTPYQPDSNVLNYTNPIGSSSGPGPSITASDSCAAYGNRNFWWYFNSWFGPSVDTNVYLVEETGTSTIYVVYDGQKQGIPSIDVLDAWGLNGLPVTSLDSSIFNTIPTASTALTRYAINTQTGQTYFADNSNTYFVSPNDATIWGNFPGQNQSQVSSTLINFSNYQGEIKPYVTVSGNSTFYAMDNGTLHPITSAAAYDSWAGGPNSSPMQLSSAYFNTISSSGSDISYPEFTVGPTTYVVSDGEIFSLNSNTANLVPTSWSGLTIGFALANSFINGGPLKYMVQVPGTPSVYLLDTGGTLRAMPDLATDSAYQIGSSSNTSEVSNDFLSYLTTGSIISSNIVTINGQSYVMNNGLQSIPSSLDSAYNISTNAITLNNAYQNIFPALSAATDVVDSGSSPAIYYIDSGTRYPFSNPTTFNLVAGNSAVTNLLPNTISKFTASTSIMQNYVTNGTTNYLIDNGKSYTVPAAGIASAWNLGQPITLSSTATSNFSNIGTLSQYVQIPNGQMCLIDHVAYCAGQAPLVTMWNLNSATIKPSQLLLNSLGLNNTPISPFVSAQPGQPNFGTIYTVAKGHLLGITSLNAALNLGISNYPMTTLDSYTLNNLISGQTWQGYLAQDDSGNIYILDNGTKHPLPSQYQSAWVSSYTPTILGSDYLSLLPTGQPISNAINSITGPTIYGVISGKLYGFTSPQTYTASGVGPSVIVSNSLLRVIPPGGNL